MKKEIFTIVDIERNETRQAGVRRGINASITTLENLRELHSKRSSGYLELTKAITALEKLTVDVAEEI